MTDFGPKIDFLQKEFALGGRDLGFLEKPSAAHMFEYALNFLFVNDKLWDINIGMLSKTNEGTKEQTYKREGNRWTSLTEYKHNGDERRLSYNYFQQ